MNDDAIESPRYEFSADHLVNRADWVRVEGGDLPMPIEIRVERAPDGRHVFTGLRIGIDDRSRAEITSQALREIRLSEILAAYYEVFQPDYALEMESSIAEVSYPVRQHGPDNMTLFRFARTYQAELARQPHRAMSAAAKAHNISRATANRWAAICREIGMLPAVSSGEEPSS